MAEIYKREVIKIGVITIIKEVKSIHPEEVVLVKLGGFYKSYGKDAYILSNLLGYKVKIEEEIVSVGFPVKSLNKVVATLENKKVSYIILDSRDNYNVNTKMQFGNLNKYEKEFFKSNIYVKNKIRIEKIYEYLIKNSKKESLKNKLKELEKIINEWRKI